MRKSVKGALLSGVVFPGLGQLWLKQYARGMAFIAAVSVALALMVAKAAHQAFAILQKLEASGGAIDLVAVVKTAREASSAANDMAALGATVVVSFCWVVAAVDAYLTGARLDAACAAEKGEALLRVAPEEEPE